MVEGEAIPHKITLSQLNKVCDACMYGRQVKLPFEDASLSYEPLELTHLNISGLIQPRSLSDAKYIITFINHFS